MGLVNFLIRILHTKAVNAFIVDNNKLLTVKRKEMPWPGMYVMPGGRIEKGESEEQAVIREVKEETGYDIKVEKYLATGIFRYYFVPYSVAFYKARITGGKEHIQHEEISEIKWMSLDDFLDNLKENKFSMKGIDRLVKIVEPHFVSM